MTLYARFTLSVLLISTALAAYPAHAQYSDGNGDSATAAPIASAQAEVRISGLEEELRTLRGKIEENEFQIRKLNDTIEKMQRDTEFRFNELSHGSGGATIAVTPSAATAPETAATPETKKIEIVHERKPININPDEAPTINGIKPVITPGNPNGATTAGSGILQLPEEGGENGEFANPRDHYNYAFRLFNQQQYVEAAASFEEFTKKYPSDPLIGNAYYWLGDSYFKRSDYVTAADDFRQGFEALPKGPKAADNLLKLAMSLDALKRDKEACVVLQQVQVKFSQTSTTATDKAQQEQKRIGCK